MFKPKKSIFERLAHIINTEPDDGHDHGVIHGDEEGADMERGNLPDESSEGQLTVDVYQTPTEIIIQAMVAGVKSEDLEVSINREMVTIKGSRERTKSISDDNYFFQELYWGSFSRTIVLPEEIDVEAAEATENKGLLTLRLPKIDKKKVQKLKVKNG